MGFLLGLSHTTNQRFQGNIEGSHDKFFGLAFFEVESNARVLGKRFCLLGENEK